MTAEVRPPSQEPAGAGGGVWLAATLLAVAPLLAAVCLAMWRAPYPISETVALLDGAGIMEESAATSLLDDATFRSFFDPADRSWYRPLYHLTWYTLWQVTGSLRDTLTWFKVIEVGAVAALVLLFVWCLRPQSMLDFASATFATAVLMGAPAFRENLELPLLYTLVGMGLMLAAWRIAQHGPRAWHGPVLVTLTLVAIGFKEQGLVIVPLLMAAWWMGAPGVSGRTVVTVTACAVAYLVFRLANRGAWGAFEQDFGFLFSTLSAAEASARFGEFPLPMYVYNVASTASNILFSEPTSGRFLIVESVLTGRASGWQINHLVSSAVLTLLVGWWGFRTWRRRRAGLDARELQVLAAAVVTLAASAPLGFNYTRDRLGGMALVFYAMAAYFAMRAAANRSHELGARRTAAVLTLLVLLAGAWQLRAVATVDGEHLRAARTQREWMTNLQRRRVEYAGNRTYLRILESMARQGLEPGAAPPSPYPPRLAPWLGDR